MIVALTLTVSHAVSMQFMSRGLGLALGRRESDRPRGLRVCVCVSGKREDKDERDGCGLASLSYGSLASRSFPVQGRTNVEMASAEKDPPGFSSFRLSI